MSKAIGWMKSRYCRRSWIEYVTRLMGAAIAYQNGTGLARWLVIFYAIVA
jgi:antibiotic biosynthesis monooxygenase (ABM) superfamily enzyme